MPGVGSLVTAESRTVGAGTSGSAASMEPLISAQAIARIATHDAKRLFAQKSQSQDIVQWSDT